MKSHTTENSQSKLIKTLYLKDLKIENSEVFEENKFILRKTSKTILIKGDLVCLIKINNILLPGGGVEGNESFEEALHREMKEELGIEVDIKDNIGHIINYRVGVKKKSSESEYTPYKKYHIECFVCEFKKEISINKEGELMWISLPQAIKLLSDSYKMVEGKAEHSQVAFNLKTHIYFLKEYRYRLEFLKKEFDKWSYLKKNISEKSDNDMEDFYFREREVWWCAVGVNVGHEQDGKGGDFLRPVLVYKKLDKYSFIGIPFSSNKKIGDYRVDIVVTSRDDLVIRNDALIDQIKSYDVRRIRYHLGILSVPEFAKIKRSIQNLIA